MNRDIVHWTEEYLLFSSRTVTCLNINPNFQENKSAWTKTSTLQYRKVFYNISLKEENELHTELKSFSTGCPLTSLFRPIHVSRNKNCYAMASYQTKKQGPWKRSVANPKIRRKQCFKNKLYMLQDGDVRVREQESSFLTQPVHDTASGIRTVQNKI
ncbi:hypothetical protein CDL12_29408 [Handroanthus impetiginosus]|uniref:Uncharacterized protein n=1 Tax=Handroanthus impetiginosus TaxID=429701 RepID=A0A2G9FYG7_9LAMI|nr:hypothetical protein CDL12_29408 [Handroanthus impetiginosus]